MKTFVWFIIVLAIALGILYLYRKNNPAPAPAPTVKESVEPAKTQEPPPTPKTNSEKGIQNWRPVKKVRDLNDQHNKDLMNNM